MGPWVVPNAGVVLVVRIEVSPGCPATGGLGFVEPVGGVVEPVGGVVEPVGGVVEPGVEDMAAAWNAAKDLAAVGFTANTIPF